MELIRNIGIILGAIAALGGVVKLFWFSGPSMNVADYKPLYSCEGHGMTGSPVDCRDDEIHVYAVSDTKANEIGVYFRAIGKRPIIARVFCSDKCAGLAPMVVQPVASDADQSRDNKIIVDGLNDAVEFSFDWRATVAEPK